MWPVRNVLARIRPLWGSVCFWTAVDHLMACLVLEFNSGFIFICCLRRKNISYSFIKKNASQLWHTYILLILSYLILSYLTLLILYYLFLTKQLIYNYFLCSVLFLDIYQFSLNRPSGSIQSIRCDVCAAAKLCRFQIIGPMLSISQNVCLCVRVSVHFWGTV